MNSQIKTVFQAVLSLIFFSCLNVVGYCQQVALAAEEAGWVKDWRSLKSDA